MITINGARKQKIIKGKQIVKNKKKMQNRGKYER